MTENQNNPSTKIKRHFKKYKNYYIAGATVLLIVGVSRRVRGECPITGAPLPMKALNTTRDSTLHMTINARGDFDAGELKIFTDLVYDFMQDLINSADPAYRLAGSEMDVSYAIKPFKIAEHLPELVSTVADATDSK